jgi:nitroimidazol reductase NimA-like FMN-containing flavoprotein (pyridoxamine 5'-phosphate oxidase superfamily)
MPLPETFDHRGLAVLTLSECLQRLRVTSLGRLAFVQSGSVVIVPVNYVLDGMTVMLRSTLGTKLQVAEDSRPVGFEIDGRDPDPGPAWSVLVQGVAQVVDDPVTVRRCENLDLAPAPGHDPTASWIGIRADEISGRQIPLYRFS